MFLAYYVPGTLDVIILILITIVIIIISILQIRKPMLTTLYKALLRTLGKQD